MYIYVVKVSCVILCQSVSKSLRPILVWFCVNAYTHCRVLRECLCQGVLCVVCCSLSAQHTVLCVALSPPNTHAVSIGLDAKSHKTPQSVAHSDSLHIRLFDARSHKKILRSCVTQDYTGHYNLQSRRPRASCAHAPARLDIYHMRYVDIYIYHRRYIDIYIYIIGDT
jgi:hypothetical protein